MSHSKQSVIQSSNSLDINIFITLWCEFYVNKSEHSFFYLFHTIYLPMWQFIYLYCTGSPGMASQYYKLCTTRYPFRIKQSIIQRFLNVGNNLWLIHFSSGKCGTSINLTTWINKYKDYSGIQPEVETFRNFLREKSQWMTFFLL